MLSCKASEKHRAVDIIIIFYMCNNDCLQGCDLAMDMYVLRDALETQILFTI